MYQQEIKFFWPLTEQIPLDLDYSNCVVHKIASPTVSNIVVSCGGGGGAISYSTRVEVDSIETTVITIKLDKKPNIVVRWLYKLLNIKWK